MTLNAGNRSGVAGDNPPVSSTKNGPRLNDPMGGGGPIGADRQSVGIAILRQAIVA
jgi:hypothetical protein